MSRYVTAAAIAGLLLAVALKARKGEEPSPIPGAIVVDAVPDVEAVRVPGGIDLTVRHRFAGSVSSACLVYRFEGSDRTLDRTTNCEKSLERTAKFRSDGQNSEVRLGGHLPNGGSDVRLVLEDETGPKIVLVDVVVE